MRQRVLLEAEAAEIGVGIVHLKEWGKLQSVCTLAIATR